MPNAWITHVKQYAADNNISYKQALSEAKSTYKPSSDKQTKPSSDEPSIEIPPTPEVVEEKPKKKRAPRKKK